MIALRVISALALVSVCSGAKSTAGSKFGEYQSQFLSSPPLKLNDKIYDELTTATRNYSTVVLLTALEARFGCKLCKDYQPEWELLSKSWVNGDKKGESKVVFGTLDFNDGRETFQKLMLQTAPVLLLFPPTIGQNSRPDGQAIRYDFTSGPQTAEQTHAWIVRTLPSGIHPSVRRPLNYMRIVIVTTIVLGLASFLSVAYPYVIPVITNRTLWAAISLLAILLFTSGHMFNHIRHVPYVSGDGKGGITYFAGGFSNQLGLETQIVAAMYGTLSFATIALALKVPRIADPKAQQATIVISSVVLFVMYSFLLSVFRIKNGGYPFHLPPF